LLVADKYDPKVNLDSGVDMQELADLRPAQGSRSILDRQQGEDHNTRDLPAALGTKDEQPAAYSPTPSCLYVPTKHVCNGLRAVQGELHAGQPYVGATLSMYPPSGETHMGNSSPGTARPARSPWSNKEQSRLVGLRSPLPVAWVFYGTLEGYLKAVDAKTARSSTSSRPLRHHRQRHDL